MLSKHRGLMAGNAYSLASCSWVNHDRLWADIL